MTGFNEFMSIGLTACVPDGATQQQRQTTFSALVNVWNREKEVIRAMEPAEVRDNLTCP